MKLFFASAILANTLFAAADSGDVVGKVVAGYQQAANVHCLWMQQNGIDCAALQRFASAVGPGTVKQAQFDGVATRMKNAAETYGRKFYIMYDCSGNTPAETDWTNTIVGALHLTSSPAYARQNGKPVVCFFGVGKSGRGTIAQWVAKINWFKAQGCYVIGGPLHDWRSSPDMSAYNACDMIMPWMVGSRSGFQNQYAADLAYCKAHGLDYQADIYPGTSFYNNAQSNRSSKNLIPRMHGDFMWSQFAQAKAAGVGSIYISMFDEAQEATQIFKTAENASQIPAGKWFLTLDADGVACSSDFYLRLTRDGGAMIKGALPYTATLPAPHLAEVGIIVGPKIDRHAQPGLSGEEGEGGTEGLSIYDARGRRIPLFRGPIGHGSSIARFAEASGRKPDAAPVP